MAGILGKLAIIGLTYKGCAAVHKIPNFVDAAASGFTYDSLTGPIISSTPHTEALGVPSIHCMDCSFMAHIFGGFLVSGCNVDDGFSG